MNDVPSTRAWSRNLRFVLALAAISSTAIIVSVPAIAQQKTGPGVPEDDWLRWHGITLYGVVDLGVQYDTHGAPFTPYRPAASANIVQKDSRESVVGITPSNMGQSRIGVQGTQPLFGDWSGVFQAEVFFNPQSGEIADAVKSLAVNNGRTPATQTTNLDGSSAGQVFQTAYAGLSSRRYGAISFGRQLSLMAEGIIRYDPNYAATAFGLLGASGAYSGAGSTEDQRLDSVLKYRANIADVLHVGALYKFNQSKGAAGAVYQADVSADYAGASITAIYSKVNDAISASALTPAQVTALAMLRYPVSGSLSATVSDNTAFAAMALYRVNPLKAFAGYERIRYANPATPLAVGYTDIGGYTLAFVSNSAYNVNRILTVYWAGIRYTVIPHLDLTAAYYGYHQTAYGTGSEAGCRTAAHGDCSGELEAISFDADYRFNVHFDAYVGAMYSGVHGGVANGYNFYTTNLNPTVGIRYKF